jgi:hypothetical protein
MRSQDREPDREGKRFLAQSLSLSVSCFSLARRVTARSRRCLRRFGLVVWSGWKFHGCDAVTE